MRRLTEADRTDLRGAKDTSPAPLPVRMRNTARSARAVANP